MRVTIIYKKQRKLTLDGVISVVENANTIGLGYKGGIIISKNNIKKIKIKVGE